jgi:hypothetical protein
LYQAKADVKPQNGDVVIYPNKDEQAYLGDKWDSIDGVVVHISKILFSDATTWLPAKGVDCKTVFLNENYDKEIEKRDKAFVKKWNLEHPNQQIPEHEETKP